MLLEELLGISNKRLKKIFYGETYDESSSGESELNVGSLDDISDENVSDSYEKSHLGNINSIFILGIE